MGVRVFGFNVLLVLSVFLTACSTHETTNEKWYQERWCDQQSGKSEVRLKDKTRCDCLTDAYAIEVDFARKWTEAVGQSLHYSRMTGEKAGILLIVEKKEDEKYLDRLEKVIAYHDLPIRVWVTSQSDLQ